MDGGHFIWLWADTKNTEEFFDMSEEEPDLHEHHSHQKHSAHPSKEPDELPTSMNFDMFSGETMKMKRDIGTDEENRLPQPFENFNEWLLNDTSSDSGERKLRRTSSYSHKKLFSSQVFFHQFKDFPVGLLALKPIKIQTDYNFVKSTIRLFVSTWADVRANVTYLDDGLDMGFVRGRRRLLAEYKSRRRRHLASTETQFIVNKVKSSSSNSSAATFIGSGRSDNKSSDIYNFYKIKNNNQEKNQNLSGLILLNNTSKKQTQQPNFNTSKSNILFKLKLTNFTNLNTKRKRFNWWSFMGSGQSSGRPVNSGERFKIPPSGAPYYRGGCFGVFDDKDVKRAEMFAR